jgi:hypothetical protein
MNKTVEEYFEANKSDTHLDNFEILMGLMFAFGDHEYKIEGYSQESKTIKINCVNEKNQPVIFEYQAIKLCLPLLAIAQLALIN